MSETTTEYVLAKKDDLVSVADAIREKTGGGGSPLGLSDLSSLITDIETGGGADEILSLFGATNYEIKTTTKSGEYYNSLVLTNSLNSVDDIKLIFGVSETYKTGISLTLPSCSTGGGNVDCFILLNMNGLFRVWVVTNTNNYVSTDSYFIRFKSTSTNIIELNNSITASDMLDEVLYDEPLTCLVIYNAVE